MKVVASREYIDWRELRFESFTLPQVGKMLATMAIQIVAALDRGNRVQSSVPAAAGVASEHPPQSAVRVESTEVASSEQTSGVTRRGASKTEPSTRVVDALHRGDHQSLTEALNAAHPGDRILVRPGLYQEGIVIDKPVEIIGDGELGEVVIEATGKDAVLFQARMGRITNLTLRQAGGGQWYGVDITQGRLDIEGCDITSKGLACVAIRGGADPRLRRNRIHDGKASGVFVYDNGQGTLEDNEIFDNALAGVEIKSGGNPTLRRNRIHDGKGGGVLVHFNGQGTLEDNEISGNALAGVEIKIGGNPTLRRNRIHDGKASGVFVHDNGQGTLEDNEIFGNARAGVAIESGGNPTLRRNRIHDGKGGGVFVYDKGQGTLEDNEIFGNALTGVEVKSGGNPTLRRNRIMRNTLEAIWINKEAQGVFEDNDLRGNTKGAWKVSPESLAKVTRTRNRK